MGIQNDTQRGLSREHTTFETQFSRARNTLHFLAQQILMDSQLAHQVVEHCWIIGSQLRVTCDTDGAFRSWLLRLAIDEALITLDRRRKSVYGGQHERRSHEPSPGIRDRHRNMNQFVKPVSKPFQAASGRAARGA
jgi:hypothetical protein